MSTTMTMTETAQETRDYKKGEHYVELDNPIKEMPPVVVFFSFLDRTSREWAIDHEIVPTIRRHVPGGTEIARFHSSEPYSQLFGDDLTHAWAVARELGLDDKVIAPLFEAIQGETKIIDMQGVKAVFDHVGMPPMRYDKESSKLSVNDDRKWMDECRHRLDIKKVPSMVVAGRYLIKPEAFGDDFNAEKVADLVKKLLEL